ncbi:MAG: tRNA epoxyqueuosine(34) reductase QueG [Rhodospirillaceae bacterium]|jgi:epoxyqueuosine reductase|nr:tRNA epoxyqueuosine(34) reductase QueG [Rhodospirillaceae bacterium]
MRIEDRIKEKARELGFDSVGITAADVGEREAERFQTFIADGEYGEMDWMAAKAERRRHPQALWPEARSIIMLGTNYAPEDDPLEVLRKPDRGYVSVYARNRDYHDLVKKRLKRLARWLVEETKSTADVKVFVDTAPVLEKPLAASAGLGWQGKHTNLVSREFGSWMFLGEVFTTLELTPDTPDEDHCGTCRKCLDACPTDAFPTPYTLDARRCIAYLTIEHKGMIAPEFRSAIGNRIYGCDDCLGVCPWNKFAKASQEAAFIARSELVEPKLAEFLALDDAAFRERFQGSPIKRIGRDRFLRNVLIAAGNSGNKDLAGQIEPLIDDASPLVRAMAIWALFQLSDPDRLARLRAERIAQEPDTSVRLEWGRIEILDKKKPATGTMPMAD